MKITKNQLQEIIKKEVLKQKVLMELEKKKGLILKELYEMEYPMKEGMLGDAVSGISKKVKSLIPIMLKDPAVRSALGKIKQALQPQMEAMAQENPGLIEKAKEETTGINAFNLVSRLDDAEIDKASQMAESLQEGFFKDKLLPYLLSALGLGQTAIAFLTLWGNGLIVENPTLFKGLSEAVKNAMGSGVGGVFTGATMAILVTLLLTGMGLFYLQGYKVVTGNPILEP